MVKTFLLLAAMTALFMVVGSMIGGESGMMTALVFALVTNAFAYWFSDSIVLKMYRAKPIGPSDHPGLHQMIASLSARAGIPVPKAYIIENPQPNAFATGRSPHHAAVAVTTGLLEMLESREIAGVLAHELAHIKNRDTLIMTVTATIAGAISALAHFAMFFGGSSRDSRFGPIGAIAVAILAPLAATVVQFAISRTREYSADATGAEISGEPLALASALGKISSATRRIPNIQAENNPATAHLFISNPLHMHKVDGLFSTHPHPQNRINALKSLAAKMGQAVGLSEAAAVHKDPITRKGTFGF